MTESSSRYPSDLVTLTTAETEFQAGILHTVLEEAGIQSFTFGAMNAMTPMGQNITPVLVQVRRADLERACAALKQNIADSVDIDWDEVEVGEPTDQVSLKNHLGMPTIMKLGFVVAAIAVLIMLVGAVLALMA